MGNSIMGLTLLEPWATLMALGAKSWETRSWRTSHRGWLAIHASRTLATWQRELAQSARFRPFLTGYGIDRPFPLGCIMAVGRLVDCQPTTVVQRIISEQEQGFGDYTPGRWAWQLTDIMPLPEPVPCQGRKGLWPLPPTVQDMVMKQLQGMDARRGREE